MTYMPNIIDHLKLTANVGSVLCLAILWVLHLEVSPQILAGMKSPSYVTDLCKHTNFFRRLMLGSTVVLPLIVCAQVYFCPESPRWLVQHGKVAKAFKSFRSKHLPNINSQSEAHLSQPSAQRTYKPLGIFIMFTSTWSLRRKSIVERIFSQCFTSSSQSRVTAGPRWPVG